MDAEHRRVIAAFVDETREALEEIEPTLVELERRIGTPDERPLITNIFGLMHSAKGSAGLVGFGEIGRVAHAAEAVIQKVREGELELDGAIVDLLCQGLDFVTDRLGAIEATGSDLGAESVADAIVARCAAFAPEIDEPRDEPGILLFDDPVEAPRPADDLRTSFVAEGSAEIERCAGALGRIADGEPKVELVDEVGQALHRLRTACSSRELADLDLAAKTAESIVDRLRNEIRGKGAPEVQRQLCAQLLQGLPPMREALADYGRQGTGRIADLDEVAAGLLGTTQRVDSSRLGEILLQAAYVTPEVLEEAIARQYHRPRLGEVLLEMDALAPEELDRALEVQQETREGREPPPLMPPRAKRHETLRVDVDKVDRLMDLVGELIIGVTSVVHHPSVQALDSGHFVKSAAQLTRVTRDLQDVAMSLRMIPVSGTFRKMKRLVRDLSKKLGKQIRLVVSGEETEVDKSVAEVLADPLVHLVRNALDHGLESPEERVAAGKGPEGTVHLTARHQGGELWIEIIDDGRGIDRERVHARALRRGITTLPLADLADHEVLNFIFEPGFSTAVHVSEVSGRGIGMDVVKRNVESVNGRIEVHSAPGEGTRIALRIPLTLAIIEGMLVRVGRSCFTIPLLQIRESMVVGQQDLTVLSNGQEIVRVRDQLLPLVRMHQFYDIAGDHDDIGRGIVMVVEDAGGLLCLFVDELIGQRQTVIKGLSGYLRAVRGLSGCTVLGDGRISFILDVASLRSHAVAQGVA